LDLNIVIFAPTKTVVWSGTSTKLYTSWTTDVFCKLSPNFRRNW